MHSDGEVSGGMTLGSGGGHGTGPKTGATMIDEPLVSRLDGRGFRPDGGGGGGVGGEICLQQAIPRLKT